MVRRALVLVLAFCAVSIGARAAYACSCAGRPDLRAAVAEADVAFSGTVVRALGGAKYQVRVDSVLKGTLPPVVTLRADSSSSCSTTLTPGPIVYAAGRNLRVAQCMPVWRGEGARAALAASGLQATGVPVTPESLIGTAAGRDVPLAVTVVLLLAGVGLLKLTAGRSRLQVD